MSWLSAHLPPDIRYHLCSLRTRLRRSLVVPWRALFVGTTFIGVTGSHGKTTTTMLLGSMLRCRGKAHVGLWFNEAAAIDGAKPLETAFVGQ